MIPLHLPSRFPRITSDAVESVSGTESNSVVLALETKADWEAVAVNHQDVCLDYSMGLRISCSAFGSSGVSSRLARHMLVLTLAGDLRSPLITCLVRSSGNQEM